MKITITAKPLAAALGLAASLVDPKLKIPVLRHAHLVAEGETLGITANVLDFAVRLSLPAMVKASGEVAIASAQLAALAAGFPADSEIAISSDDKTAHFSCGRSRFRLPLIPVIDLSPMPAIDNETGRVELAREELQELLSRPAFAISTEKTRYYLGGILLHDTDAGGLAAVATDGHRLGRVILPSIGELSQDRRLIVPHAAIKILLKLLAEKAVETLTLRRSKALLEVTAAGFVFTTKLIDAEYPTYERVLPEPSGNTAMVDRAELARAIERVAAVVPEKAVPVAGLLWAADEPVLRVCVPGWPDLASDPVAAETSGSGRIAFKINYGLELLDALKGERVRIDSSAVPGSPIHITDPDDADFLVVQMPVAWFAETSQAA
jgi:DNA polymerase III subunit beta